MCVNGGVFFVVLGRCTVKHQCAFRFCVDMYLVLVDLHFQCISFYLKFGVDRVNGQCGGGECPSSLSGGQSGLGFGGILGYLGSSRVWGG